MNARLRTNFERGFFLTEENLIKINDIIKKRLSPVDTNIEPTFRLTRADGMVVEFSNPNSVAEEENSTRNAIKRIEIFSVSEDHKIILTFDEKEETDLIIESTNRDLAHLLASDIKDYINSEVLKFRSFKFTSLLNSQAAIPILMTALALMGFYGIKESPNQEMIELILESTNIHEKLNFLIENRAAQNLNYSKWLVLGLIPIFFSLILLGPMLDKAYPRNIFYWGKKTQSYDKIKDTRGKIFWGIAIAFLISVVSAYFVNYIK